MRVRFELPITESDHSGPKRPVSFPAKICQFLACDEYLPKIEAVLLKQNSIPMNRAVSLHNPSLEPYYRAITSLKKGRDDEEISLAIDTVAHIVISMVFKAAI
jgi:hypothetical protein